MRLTNIMLKARNRSTNPNMYHMYKVLWMTNGNRMMKENTERPFLQRKGIQVVQPKDIFTPAYETPRYEDYFPPPPSPVIQPEVLHSVDSRAFSPLLGSGLPLMQQLCHAVLCDALPQSVVQRARELKKDEQRLVIEDIISAHLLDGSVDQLPCPHNLELPNKLEWRHKRIALPIPRKNRLLTSYLNQTFAHTSLDMVACLDRYNRSDDATTVRVAMRYKDDLLLLEMAHSHSTGGYCPLPPVMDPREADLFVPKEIDDKTTRMILRKQIEEEKGGPLQQPLPLIAPMLPYVGAQQLDQYDDDLSARYVTPSPEVFPHTVYIHHNAHKLGLNHDQLTSLTLLHLHTHALSYAVTKGVKMNEMGHLDEPIVVQGVHSHNDIFQPSVYQLNTLGPHAQPLDALKLDRKLTQEGANVRNVFYYNPFSAIYKQCEYVDAKPTLSGVNYELISTLRALYESGIQI